MMETAFLQTPNGRRRTSTYRMDVQGTILLSRTWSTIVGTQYRRHENDQRQNLITVFTKVRFIPTNKLRANWNVTYNRETRQRSSELVGDMTFDYNYRTLTLFLSWKLRYYSHHDKSMNHDIYIKVRRSFDYRLK